MKDFAKKYKGKQWDVTLNSIRQYLKRVCALQQTQQVDQLGRNGKFWLFKYDFAVAQTNKSAKNSGNRCLVFLDSLHHVQTVLLVYAKTHLPKNQQETVYLLQTVDKQFPDFWRKLKF